MKVYSISKWTFFGICLLIVTLPLSRQWRLITGGERAIGTVTEFTMIVHENFAGEREIRYVSEVQFKSEGQILKVYGPSRYEYNTGRSIRLIYNPADPSEYCLLTFSGFYLNNYMILPIVLLIVWASFYLSFNSYTKKKRQSRSKGSSLVRKQGKLILLGIAGLTGFWMGTVRAAIREVRPSMGTQAINEVLNDSRAGDTILFAAGTYQGPFVLNEVLGQENLPIVISGIQKSEKKKSLIDGKTKPGILQGHQAFFLKNCAWISIENFTIKNCWTDLIKAENTAYLSLRNCHLTGGKRALFATGRGSHHFLIEHCTWEQDERVWTQTGDYSWDEIHHGVHSHYNGSLFQGSRISGGIVLRDNFIKNTFNAFRLSQINDGTMDPLACSNVEIYRNIIINTSDNVLEPEVHTRNLHFYHNQMINGHAFVSITEVAGGDIYIYGNTAVSLPGSEDGWTIFKISNSETSLTEPFYIFNNSWQVDFDMIGSPRHVWQNNHIRHFNNACFSEASDTFGIYNLGEDNHFDFDCSNVPFPELLSQQGFEKNGVVSDPLFKNPYNNDFHLQANSPCRDRGTPAEGLIMDYKGEAPDVGAYDNGKLIEGPPFRFVTPEAEVPFREMPRITRYSLENHHLTLWYSVPLDKTSVQTTRFMLKDGNRLTDLKLLEQSTDGYSLTFTFEGEADPTASSILVSNWPLGENGKACTFWASAIPVYQHE